MKERPSKASLKEMYGDEQVYAVPYDLVSHIGNKFTPKNDSIRSLNKYDLMGRYIRRHDAEHNPTFQQLIPCVIIADKKGERYYVSKRKAGDPRVVQFYSLGFGGHINPCDGSLSVIMTAMERELNEEVFIDMVKDSLSFIGYVRDLVGDTTDHLGFVFTVKVKRARIREREKLSGSWMTLEQLVDNYFSFESWSKHLIDYLYESKCASTKDLALKAKLEGAEH